MFTIDDILGQLGSLFNGGQYQGNGATTFAAPNSAVPKTVGTTTDFGGATLPNSQNGGFGLNLGTAGLALGGLQSLNNLIQGNKAFNLAKDQFRFQKDVANANLNNSIKSYNSSLEDRLRSRGVAQGTDAATVQDEIDRKRLSR